MRLDTETLCAALLHDTVEDTSASLEEIEAEFGEEVAQLVDGVTKLTEITFESRDERQAENYRKMMVAMATDVRVILIKLADRLHNMRTLGGAAEAEADRRRRARRSRSTRRSPTGSGSTRSSGSSRTSPSRPCTRASTTRSSSWSPSSATEREVYVEDAGELPRRGAEEGRDRGRDLRPRQALLLDLHEDDQEGPRVQRDLRPHRDAGDRRLGQGLLRRDRRHPLALEAAARAASRTSSRCRRRNMYQALHTTVIGPEGKPLEIQIRTAEMHELAEYGIAAHVAYKEGGGGRPAAREDDLAAPAGRGRGRAGPGRVPRVAEGRPVRGRGLRLHPEGRGQEPLRRLDAARLRLRGPHRRRPPLRRRQGQRQDRPAALPAEVGRHRRGADREAGARPLARLAEAGAHEPRPQQDPRLVQAASAARTPSATAAKRSRRRCESAACRCRSWPARRCSPT